MVHSLRDQMRPSGSLTTLLPVPNASPIAQILGACFPCVSSKTYTVSPTVRQVCRPASALSTSQVCISITGRRGKNPAQQHSTPLVEHLRRPTIGVVSLKPSTRRAQAIGTIILPTY